MKYLAALAIAVLLASCATKIPYTEKIRQDFNLDETNIKKVQFYTSYTIILEKNSTSGAVTTTNSDGGLVISESSSSDRVTIPPSTKCIFEKFGENGEVFIRFEPGAGKVLRFAVRPNMNNGKYYLVSEFKNGKGEVEYGNELYSVKSSAASVYLKVKLKKWQQNKRKDRVVKGMKV